LSVPTTPLEKLKVSFSANHFESFNGDLKTSYGQQYSMNTKALIYPDLTSSWSLRKSNTSTLDSNGLFADTTSISSSLKLSAQLLRKLAADARIGYNRIASGSDSRKSSSGDFTLQYRASDLLIFTGKYKTIFLGPSSNKPGKINLGMQIDLLHTDKARLDFTSSHAQEDSKQSDNFLLRGSWDINRKVALTFNSSYSIAETSNYSFLSSLAMKL
jgi:hypothetical protein